ncbi:MAG TPA: UbiA family prenyltransferase [Blastocatellia bacterium]|nr:UbiA family prenyltransferase [Blastocatellia bacterium]
MKHPAALSAQPFAEFALRVRHALARFACFFLGHHFDNRKSSTNDAGQCPCGEPLLRADDSAVHVRHNLACLLGGHTYEKHGERDGHGEYICTSCGHPMLFVLEVSSYARQDRFRKFVQPRCGLGGHPVHIVTRRDGMTEYACDCGHSFLLPQPALTKVRHPLICLLTGHFIKPFARRDGLREFRCENCGHPFCLTTTPIATNETTNNAPTRNAVLRGLLRLIRFRYHVTFISVILGALLVARGMPLSLAQSLVLLYVSFNVLLYGGIYTMNDILDAGSDRQHPYKKNRPLQSGVISLPFAAMFSVSLIVAGLLTGYWWFGSAVVALYVAILGINLFYSLCARQIPWLDIACNAAPHALRFLLGATLAGGTAPLTLLVAIFFLAFGIASTRRRLEKDVPGWQMRHVLKMYSERDLVWLRALPFGAILLQMLFDPSIPKAFYVVILAVYIVTVFGVNVINPLRQVLVAVWTK